MLSHGEYIKRAETMRENKSKFRRGREKGDDIIYEQPLTGVKENPFVSKVRCVEG